MNKETFEKVYNFKDASLGNWIRDLLTRVKYGDTIKRKFRYYSDRIDREVYVSVHVTARKKGE